ncbi:hypothetical protein B0H16DRAFT_1902507 [Mycena metata]|uniref:BTB domain-containing protein n=1 Tax=Mycena metata TaxID=1033252 RepID=A0AAD7DXF9_9AGAR|nr:hypothetical protein B0H16DRAFT_1902507 [Mycena metata]
MSESTDPTAVLKDAAVPFSGAPNDDAHPPDFIIRSSDGVDFHLHKDILKFGSACFDGMFSVSGGGDEQGDPKRDGKPVLVLPEPEAVLYRLFCLAYPPRPESLKHFFITYQFLGVQALLVKMLDNDPLIAVAPHRVFAIARLIGVSAVARKAAIKTLKHPLHLATRFPEMQLLTWADGLALQDFHRSCGMEGDRRLVVNKDARRLKPTYFTWLDDERLMKAGNSRFVWAIAGKHGAVCAGEAVLHSHISPLEWFQNHINRVQERLSYIPYPDTILTEGVNVATAEQSIINACPLCSERAQEDLAQFADILAGQLRTFNSALAAKMFQLLGQGCFVKAEEYIHVPESVHHYQREIE